MFNKKEYSWKYFMGINTIKELKKEYHRLARKYHPDCGGSTEIMQEINSEYEKLFNILKASGTDKDYKSENPETAGDFIKWMDELMKFDDLIIDINGCWLWVSGPGTFALKDTFFKPNGWKFVKKPDWKGWVWFKGIETQWGKRRGSRKKFEQICNENVHERIYSKGGKGGSGNSGMAPANC